MNFLRQMHCKFIGEEEGGGMEERVRHSQRSKPASHSLAYDSISPSPSPRSWFFYKTFQKRERPAVMWSINIPAAPSLVCRTKRS